VRICHVIESASGGSAGVMATLAEHARREGHDVDVVYSPDRADATLITMLGNAGCRLRQAQMRRSVGPHDIKDGLQLFATLRSLAPIDVIYSHSSKAGALARSFGRVRGAAQIYSPHGFYTMTGEAPFYVRLAERLLSRVTDRIVAVSQFEADHGVAIGIAPHKLAVIANGIDPFEPSPRHEARARLGLDPDDFVIGFVGRLTEQKDPVSALAVLDHVPAGRAVTLAIIGDGELMQAVKAGAAAARHRVVLAGGVPARALLTAFDCLLCTSRYEGMPVSFLEALNCAVPIVTYDVGGAAELVASPATGFVTVHDPAAAATAVEWIMRMRPAERAALAQRCRSVAIQYSAGRMSDATLTLYQAVVPRCGC
jgi:glycosyltransferase involved in cell wall biosynthesis